MSRRDLSLPRAWRSLVHWWHWLLFAPQDMRVCAAVRIGYALVMLLNLAVLYPDLVRWFTDEGLLPTAAAREVAGPFAWSVLWHLPSTPALVETCFWIWAAQTVLLGIGLFSRLNAACVWVWLVSFQNRNVQILDSEDNVLRLVLLCLVLMPCGAAWSADARLWRWMPRRLGPNKTEHLPVESRRFRPALGLRLLQIQMCLIFLAAGLWKIGGEAWLDGTALYYVARLEDFFGRFPSPAWLWDTPWVVALLTWSVVAAELLVPLFVWFRETRRAALVVAVLFHLANEYTMYLFLFHWIMLVGWLSFARAADFRWLFGTWQKRTKPAL